jgi:LysM repeat protein
MKRLAEIYKSFKVLTELEYSGKYFEADKQFIKIANDIPQYQGSTTIQPGQKFEVPADQSNIDVISNVAKTGDPAKATIGGETVWITHGAEGQSGADQKYLLPDQFTPLFKSTNPDFESTGNLSDSDKNAGVQAGITTDNNIWINAQGMQKYVGSDKWIACHNLENGASFGQYGGSKGAITVQTEETPDGDKKLYFGAE